MSTTTTTPDAQAAREITFTIDPRERDQVAVVRQVVLYAALCLQPDDDGHCDAETAIDMLEGAAGMLRKMSAASEEDEA
jgi:hypothetical protein